MIISRRALTLAEARSYLKPSTNEEKNPVEDYFKAFTKLSKEDAIDLAEKIRALNNPKINEEHVIRTVDFLPKDNEDLSKIFNESVLSEEETNAILALTTKY